MEFRATKVFRASVMKVRKELKAIRARSAFRVPYLRDHRVLRVTRGFRVAHRVSRALRGLLVILGLSVARAIKVWWVIRVVKVTKEMSDKMGSKATRGLRAQAAAKASREMLVQTVFRVIRAMSAILECRVFKDRPETGLKEIREVRAM